jgi:hypothetical protein
LLMYSSVNVCNLFLVGIPVDESII